MRFEVRLLLLVMSALVTGGSLGSFSANAEPAIAAEEQKLGLARYAPNYEDATLKQIFDDFRDKTGNNLFVNWPALKEHGITENSTVNLSSDPIPGRLIVLIALQSLEPADIEPSERIVLREYDNILEVGLFQELAVPTEARVYDVRDLVRGNDDFPEDQLIQQIMTIVTESVGNADDWNNGNGAANTIRDLNGHLIVKTTANRHDDVDAVLADLRQEP
ncbi:MAG: hypothetical protein AAGF84_08260 [Planctomycetota bacterium]